MEETVIEKMYKRFKGLKENALVDCQFDKTKVLESGFNISTNISKWIGIKTDWSRLFRDKEEIRKKQYRKLFEFYQTEYKLKLSNKDEYTLFIESDPEYVDIYNQCMIIKEVIQFIDATIDTLKSKGYEVKNFIEYQKFINGK